MWFCNLDVLKLGGWLVWIDLHLPLQWSIFACKFTEELIRRWADTWSLQVHHNSRFMCSTLSEVMCIAVALLPTNSVVQIEQSLHVCVNSNVWTNDLWLAGSPWHLIDRGPGVVPWYPFPAFSSLIRSLPHLFYFFFFSFTFPILFFRPFIPIVPE